MFDTIQKPPVVVHDFQADIDAIGRIDAVATMLDVVCRTTGMGFAAVARVTENRWIACRVHDRIDFGLATGGELKVETTICNEIREHREIVVINHVAEDEAYCHHPTAAMYGFQSYISMPIILRDGRFFGTLCAIDPRPAQLNNPETIGMFKLFAELIASHLAAEDDLQTARAQLVKELELSELREQFIAVLGHDLRNPLASIDAGIHLLSRAAPDQRSRKIISLMQGTVGRMQGLINNVLDLARARLGNGLELHVSAKQPVRNLLEQVLSEAKAIESDRQIETNFALTDPVELDPLRIAQLFSNLLSNALTHGSRNDPIRIDAATRNGIFELSVSNKGAPIPADVLGKLFLPFFRGRDRRTQQGLGLGLYIASEIARLHGGTLGVSSDEAETRFTFRMPLSQHPLIAD